MERLAFFQPSAEKVETISDYITLDKELTNPYLLYLNIENLLDVDSDYIYFFVYVMGKKKIVAWGIYNKLSQNFSVDGACKYQVQQLKDMVAQWSSNKYEYTTNYIKDKFTDRINSLLDRPTSIDRKTYEEYKALVALLNGNLNIDIFIKFYPDYYEELVGKFGEDFSVNGNFEVYEDNIIKKIREYEKKINRNDGNMSLFNKIGSVMADNLRKITDRFYEQIKTGELENEEYYQALDMCPDLALCESELVDNCGLWFNGMRPEYSHSLR